MNTSILLVIGHKKRREEGEVVHRELEEAWILIEIEVIEEIVMMSVLKGMKEINGLREIPKVRKRGKKAYNKESWWWWIWTKEEVMGLSPRRGRSFWRWAERKSSKWTDFKSWRKNWREDITRESICWTCSFNLQDRKEEGEIQQETEQTE